MASYTIPNLPYTFTPDMTACDYTYSDGFKIEFPANCFQQATSLTISSPVKKAFFLRKSSQTDKSFVECAGSYYKITWNSGSTQPSIPFSITLPHKAQFSVDTDKQLFNVYRCTQSVIDEDDPGNWQPCATRGGVNGTNCFKASPAVNASFGFFMVAHRINGRDDYTP